MSGRAPIAGASKSTVTSGAARLGFVVGELACVLGSVPRAVGQACGANPFPLATPCHRVLAKLGPGGFAHARGGWLLETKLWLLQHEQAI